MARVSTIEQRVKLLEDSLIGILGWLADEGLLRMAPARYHWFHDMETAIRRASRESKKGEGNGRG